MEKRYIDRLIALQWTKKCNNYSDAHFRAQEITRLEKLKESWKKI